MAGNRPPSAQARANAVARSRDSARPRGIDPATCEVDYSADELELLRAMDRYKARTGRMFPTYCEVLGVLRGLGYRKVAAPDDEEPPCPESPTG